jgi:rubrerythrin
MTKQINKMTALLRMQKNEITEHLIYSKIAKAIKDKHNKDIISRIAKDELRHHQKLIEITKTHVAPSML